MSGMAEVLRIHTRRSGIRDLAIHCECGWKQSIVSMASSKGAFAAHQADMLTAAGFGPVKEAWDEGYTTGNAHNGRRDANPYRAAAVRGEG